MGTGLRSAVIVLNKVVFEYMISFYFLMWLIRDYKPNFLSVINLNYIFIVIIFFGIFLILTYKRKEQEKVTKIENVLLYLLVVIGGILVYIKTESIGVWSYFFIIATLMLILLLNKIILNERVL